MFHISIICVMLNNVMVAHKRESDQAIQTIAEHLQGTAELCKRYTKKIGLPLMGELAGLLHDFGKYAEDFQRYIQSGTGMISPNSVDFIDIKKAQGKIDHSTAGAQYVWQNIADTKGVYEYIRQIVALCIASHHSGLIDCLTIDGVDVFFRRIQKDFTKTHYCECVKSCDEVILNRVNELLDSSDLSNEFKRICQKIPRRQSHLWLGFLGRVMFSSLIDADRTDTIDFLSPSNRKNRLHSEYPTWEEFLTALEKRLTTFKSDGCINDIRVKISKECSRAGARPSGLTYTLTVPTGGGKTLASLRWAMEHARHYNMDRILYIIPYTSIIDQNAKEVRDICQNLSLTYGKELILEHHSNILPESIIGDDESVSSRHALMEENWDAPIIFTTMVQFLNTLFGGGTTSVRRMHNLVNSVIIFDEIQTLPIKMVYLFNQAMNFLTQVCGSSALLCTATQPLLHKVSEHALKLASNPEIVSDVSALFQQLERVEIFDQRKTNGWNLKDVVDLIQTELDISGNVLTIVNTRKNALKLFDLCKMFDATVYHLSTRMCPEHRLQVIEEIKELLASNPQKRVVCISTQLIEAGVDLDFGSVVRYVAGIDSILQAAGRCNRNGTRKDKGRVFVINPKNEKIDALPDILKGQECGERVLDEFIENPIYFENSLLSPKVVECYFTYYFYQREQYMKYPIFDMIDTSLISLLSTNEIAKKYKVETKERFPLTQSFKTASEHFQVIDSAQTTVVVPYNDEAIAIIGEFYATDDLKKEKELLRKVQRFSVNCYENDIKKLKEKNAIRQSSKSGVYCLGSSFYSDQVGIVFEEILNKSMQYYIL